jgi:predicted ATPase
MFSYLSHCKIVGLYERFDIEQSFQKGVNVIYGENGVGKTTFLHIISNFINEDYARFYELPFKWMRFEFSDGKIFCLKKEDEDQDAKKYDKNSEAIYYVDNQTRREIRISKDSEFHAIRNNALYFPSFRSMVEAWYLSNREKLKFQDSQREISLTKFSRDIFGNFVPIINYPSISEVEVELSRELEIARSILSDIDRKVLAESFREIFSTISDDQNSEEADPDKILEEIQELAENIKKYPLDNSVLGTDIRQEIFDIIENKDKLEKHSFSKLLIIYRNAMKEIVEAEEHNFSRIKHYLDTVNGFLVGKKLQIVPDENSKKLRLSFSLFSGRRESNEETNENWNILSSGERQVVTLIYTAIYLRSQSLVLIDEPEISLHVDWQRKLIHSLEKHLQNKQIIACTHSPVIGANHDGSFQALNLRFTDISLWNKAPLYRNSENFLEGEDIENEDEITYVSNQEQK